MDEEQQTGGATRAEGELTSSQVADYLGVKVQTVYAYVSRGVLTPTRREPGTGSLFAVDEVQALVRGGRSGRRGGPAASDDVRTQLTDVTAGALAYRGHDVLDLVGARSFEQVRRLLVRGEEGMPSRGAAPGVPADGGAEIWPGPTELAALEAVTAALPRGTTALDRFKHAVLVAGATDPGRHDRSPAAVARAGERAAAFMALSLPGARATPRAGPGLAATLATGLVAGAAVPVDLVEAALVLLADHDMAVSTTAVRVAVSSGADPYSALLAGLAAADSPLHVAASQ